MTNSDSDSANSQSTSDRYNRQGIARALKLLDVLAEAGGTGFTVTELAPQIGASKSTTFALLRTLVANDYAAEVQPGPRYRLGRAVIRLADSLTEGLGLTDICKPVMQDLTATTGWTTRLAISDGGYPVFVDRVDGPGIVRFHTPLGRREFPHHSAAGKAILAAMPTEDVEALAKQTKLPGRTRHTITSVHDLLADLEASQAKGFAVDDEEDVAGVFCVAAAFFNREREVLGSISITGLKLDITTWRVRELGDIVRAHADRISAGLGGPTWDTMLAKAEKR